MGFLKRLLGSKPTFEDRVWYTQVLKFVDLTRRLASESKGGQVDSLVVYHFPDTGEALRAQLNDLSLEHEFLSRPSAAVFADLRGRIGSTIAVVNSSEIPEEIQRGVEPRRREGVTGRRACHVHLSEHFPMPYRDDHVLHLGTVLPPESKFFCYVGLDEPWFESTLGGTTRTLLEQLGMPDDEPIVHSMVANALRRAQEQLAEKQRGIEYPSRSGKEWMDQNIDHGSQ